MGTGLDKFIQLKTGQKEPIQIIVPLINLAKQKLSPYLHFQLFVLTSADDSGKLHCSSEILLAWCNFKTTDFFWNKLHHDHNKLLALIDILGYTQGSIQINKVFSNHRQFVIPTNLTSYIDYSSKNNISKSLITSLISTLEDHYYNPDLFIFDSTSQVFITFTTPIGILPIICYPLYCVGTNRINGIDDHKNQEILWLNIFNLTAQRLNLQKTYLYHSPIINNEQKYGSTFIYHFMSIIGAMFTIIPKSLLYVPDYTRLTDGKKKKMDMWVFLTTFPDLSMSGFDCDDSAGIILQLISGFLELETNNKILLNIQALLNRYSFAMTLGQLFKEANTYVPHAYVIGFDKDYIKELLNGETSTKHKMPPLILDGTNGVEPVWCQLHWCDFLDTKKQNYNQSELLLNQHPDLRQILINDIPASIMNDTLGYGAVTTLLLPSFNNKAYHLLLTDDADREKPQFGIPLKQLLFNCSAKNIITVYELNPSKIEQIHTAMTELPLLNIPRAPSETQQTTNQKSFSFITRSIDYKNNKEVIHKALKQCYPAAKIPQQYPSFTVCKDVSYTEISVIF